MADLHLTLKKQYFDEILAGAKTEEYREFKLYWMKRLLRPLCKNKNGKLVSYTDGDSLIVSGVRDYDRVVFWNGCYCGGNLPMIALDYVKLEIQTDIETPLGKGDFFVIKLGKILEIRNVE